MPMDLSLFRLFDMVVGFSLKAELLSVRKGTKGVTSHIVAKWLDIYIAVLW